MFKLNYYIAILHYKINKMFDSTVLYNDDEHNHQTTVDINHFI